MSTEAAEARAPRARVKVGGRRDSVVYRVVGLIVGAALLAFSVVLHAYFWGLLVHWLTISCIAIGVLLVVVSVVGLLTTTRRRSSAAR
jgi:fatty acid desaturase